MAGCSALGWGMTLGPAQAEAGGVASLTAVADLLPSYIADVTGNGTLGNSDKNLIRKLIGAKRGFEVLARAG